jgi:Uncharacterized protein conserved in bacteria (DUF2188)
MNGIALMVVPNGNGWSVRRSGSVRVSATYATLHEAEKVAREKAKSQGAPLYIFGSDGRIRKRESYDANPHMLAG